MPAHQEPADYNLRRKIYRLLEAERPAPIGKWLRIGIGALIVANVVAVILESHEDIWAIYGPALRLFEIVSVIIFTLEYAMRVWVAVEKPEYAELTPGQARRAYVFSFLGSIDLIAIAPFYLAAVVPWDLRQVRAFRLLRLLKLSRHFKSLDIFFAVMHSQIANLLGATLIILILVVLSSSLMYSVESAAQPEAFGSVTQAIWWSVVTLTTVGYGDVTPITFWGKALSILIMLLGVGLVALPAAILGGKFADELQARRKEIAEIAAAYRQDGELNSQERARLAELGREAGFSPEETEHITEGVAPIAGSAWTCPKCGYSHGSQEW